MKKQTLVFLFDGFSDWEIAYLTPELNKSQLTDLVYFSIDGKQVKSMGGMVILPERSLSDINVSSIDMLILPGGAAWESNENRQLDQLVLQLFDSGKPIAAICSATVYLARLGLLDNIAHTSNDLDYLREMAPGYRGESSYANASAVDDHNVITAGGVSPIEFAREVFRKLELHSDGDIGMWYDLFKNGVWVGE